MSTDGSGDEVFLVHLEEFFRDLLLLLKTARVYPEDHPILKKVTERLSSSPLFEGGAVVSLGVSPTEVVFRHRFYGGKGTKATDLARFLFDRRVKSLAFKPGVRPFSLFRAASLISDVSLEGAVAVADSLAKEGINDLEVAALDMERVHDALSTGGAAGPDPDRDRRGQEAWLWLNSAETPPEAVGYTLASNAFWSGMECGEAESTRLMHVIVGLKERLDQGLSCLEEGTRGMVYERLSRLGKNVSAMEISRIVKENPEIITEQKYGMAALMGDLEGDKLVDVIAGVVAEDVESLDRVDTLMHLFRPDKAEAALNHLRKRLKEGVFHNTAPAIWKNLETFLFNMADNQFMDEAYKGKLREVTDRSAGTAYRVDMDFSAGAEENLGRIYVALALGGGGILKEPWRRLFDRILAHQERGEFDYAMGLIEVAEKAAPYALSSEKGLLGEIMTRFVNNARDLNRDARRSLAAFAGAHGNELLPVLVSSLVSVNRISQRKLLVELLSRLGPETAPQLVSKGKAGPWFVTRNILVVFARRPDRVALPFVVSMMDSDDARVRREAIRTVFAFGADGREALLKASFEAGREERERELARSFLARKVSA